MNALTRWDPFREMNELHNRLGTWLGCKFEKEEKNRKYHRVERSYGSFLRSFALPEGADAGKVMAEFAEGILKVHLPKSEKAKPASVEVKVS
ncbi:MAG: Hsp20 family protein [Verrucomicrobia bacterium]|nr:Hsp20 family protein [Verrucomicrobiota bacterium]